MEINPSIFKSRDIRGIYPEELNEDAALKIGQAFVRHTKAKNVVVGRDMRLSSPVLSDAIIKGIIDQGANVYNLGEIPTEYLYFAVGSNDNYDTGVMITASHNPKEYNGFKLLKKEGKMIDMIDGKSIAKLIGKSSFKKAKKMGAFGDIDVWPGYINHIFSFVDINKIKPFKVVIDAGNGMSGKVIPLIKDKLPLDIVALNFQLDGSFPAHPSNVFEKGATDEISRKVIKEKADLGFIFDGDADRIYLIDELGNFIRGDITLLFLAKYLLKENPGKGIAYNLICSKAVPEFIKAWGGEPIRTKVGIMFIRREMMEKDGIMGGEVSGHYLFKDNFYFDSGFISFLILLQIISESGKKVSEIIKEFSVYAKGAEINFKIEDKDLIIGKIKEKYSDGHQDYLEGVTVDYDDWWFNVRASQTEPLLRLTIEAKTDELLEQKKKELSALISE